MIGGSLKWPIRAVFYKDLDLCSMCWQLRTSLWQLLCVKYRPIEFGHWSVQFYATTTLLLCCRWWCWAVREAQLTSQRRYWVVHPSPLLFGHWPGRPLFPNSHLGVAVGFWYRWQDPNWIKEFLPCDSSWPCWWVQHGWTVASDTDLEEYINARLGWRICSKTSSRRPWI